MPLSNNFCDIPMDGKGTDTKISSGNEVRGTEKERPESSGGYVFVYLNVPNAGPNIRQVSSQKARSYAEAHTVYAASLMTSSYLPSAVERQNQNRPDQKPN